MGQKDANPTGLRSARSSAAAPDKFAPGSFPPRPAGQTGAVGIAPKTPPTPVLAAARLKTLRTPIHLRILQEAAIHPGDKTEDFGAGQAFRHYVLDGNIFDKFVKGHHVGKNQYILQYKAYFVHNMRDPIKAASAMFDIPPILLAGVVFNEVGGSDPIKPGVYWVRDFAHGHLKFGDADATSLGCSSVQVGNVLDALDYDPKSISPQIKGEIVDSMIHNNAFSIYVSAKFLSGLRDRYFAKTHAGGLTDEDVMVLGARYNRGPAPSADSLKKDLSYGKRIVERKDYLSKLLGDTPVAKPRWDEPIQKALDAIGEAYEKAAEGGYPIAGP